MTKSEKLKPEAFDKDGWQVDQKDDWQGNNVAFTCRACGRVFIVSGRIHSGHRTCKCGQSEGFVKGGRKSGGSAWLVMKEAAN
jgi:hypothetical protein